jgi:hypothetical protein
VSIIAVSNAKALRESYRLSLSATIINQITRKSKY